MCGSQEHLPFQPPYFRRFLTWRNVETQGHQRRCVTPGHKLLPYPLQARRDWTAIESRSRHIETIPPTDRPPGWAVTRTSHQGTIGQTPRGSHTTHTTRRMTAEAVYPAQAVAGVAGAAATMAGMETTAAIRPEALATQAARRGFRPSLSHHPYPKSRRFRLTRAGSGTTGTKGCGRGSPTCAISLPR